MWEYYVITFALSVEGRLSKCKRMPTGEWYHVMGMFAHICFLIEYLVHKLPTIITRFFQ